MLVFGLFHLVTTNMFFYIFFIGLLYLYDRKRIPLYVGQVYGHGLRFG